MRHRGIGLAFLIAGVVVGVIGQPLQAGAAPPVPTGYGRVAVKSAGISFLIPDTWEVVQYTRKQAKQLLAANPSLAARGVTVDDFLQSPFNARWDADGDGYPERSVDVQIYPGLHTLPSPTEFRSELSGAFKGVTVKRALVAKKPALVASYTGSAVREDGTSAVMSAQLYMFLGPSFPVHMAFSQGDPSDTEFDEITATIMGSIKLSR